MVDDNVSVHDNQNNQLLRSYSMSSPRSLDKAVFTERYIYTRRVDSDEGNGKTPVRHLSSLVRDWRARRFNRWGKMPVQNCFVL